MSVSLISSPNEYQPAGNPIEFVFDSTNKASCDFAYIADLYVNGVFAIRLKSFPEGANSYGVFRIERILKDYLSFDRKDGLLGFATMPNTICSYYLELRERFNINADCSGLPTTTAVDLITNTFYAWGGGLSYLEHPFYTQAQYVATDEDTKFLTHSPAVRVSLSNEFVLSFLQDGASGSNVDGIEIKTYDSGNNLLGTFYIDNTLTSLTGPERRCLSVGVGPANLNSSTLSVGSQPVIDSDVSYYTVVLKSTGSPAADVSETKTFNLYDDCSRFKSFRLEWLNRLNGFDPFTFNANSRRKVEINKSTYTKYLQTNYAIGDRGDTVLNVEAKEAYTLTSNWITEQESVWLEELWTSPEVYLKSIEIKELNITGAAYNAGLVNFAIDLGVILPTGTFFTYVVDDGSPIGMANSGSGYITGFESSGDQHTTTVPCSINAGAIITGVMTASVHIIVPVIITSTTWEEKLNQNVKMKNYTIDLKPANKINIQ